MQKQTFAQFLKTEIVSSMSDIKYRYTECNVESLSMTLYPKVRMLKHITNDEAYDIVSRYGKEIYPYMWMKKHKEPDIFEKFFKDSRDILLRVVRDMIVCMLVNNLDMNLSGIYLYTEDARNDIYNLFLNAKESDFVFDERIVKYI